jgi:hypothetical protein
MPSAGQSAHQTLDPGKPLPDVRGERLDHVRSQVRCLALNGEIVHILKGSGDIGEYALWSLLPHAAIPSASTL